MFVPIELQDLTEWLAVNAIILLLTSIILSPEYGKSRVRINRKRLRIAALTVSLLFALTLVVRILIAI